METRKKPGIGRIILRLVILTMLSIILLFLIKNSDRIRLEDLQGTMDDILGRGKAEATKLNFAPDSSNTFETYQGGLAVLSSSGLTLLDVAGEESNTIRTGYSKPSLKASGPYLLAYDIGGRSILSFKDSALQRELKLDSTILTADLSSGGWFLVAADEAGAKSTITIFDENASVVYKWFSAERYITCAALSDDHERAAYGGVRQENARIVSSIVMLKLDDADAPLAVLDIYDVLILDIAYLSDGSIAVLTENSVITLSPEGKERGQFAYDHSMLKEYSFDGDGFLLLQMSKNGVGETSEILLLDYNAKIEYRTTLNNILSTDCSGKFAGVLTSDHIRVYNSSLEEQYRSTISAGSKKLLMKEDGAALVLSSSEALIYRY